MKHLSIFLFAFLLTVGVASAQNTATVDQSGAGGHNATVMQAGSLNEAFVTQQMQNNRAVIDQGVNSPDVSSGNKATINQTGSDNDGSGHGASEGARIEQGTGNGQAINSQATIDQVADNSYVTITQGWSGPGVATGSIADVNQDGDDNDVLVEQGYSGTDNGSSAIVNQAAGTSSSTAAIYQGHGSSNSSARNTGTVNQNSGSGNFGQIAQGAEVWDGMNLVAEDNLATIDQDGLNNNGRIYQGSARVHAPVVGGSALFNTGVIDQNGDNNIGIINQGIDGTDASNSFASIVQNSDGNMAETTQSGAGNTATTTQN